MPQNNWPRLPDPEYLTEQDVPALEGFARGYLTSGEIVEITATGTFDKGDYYRLRAIRVSLQAPGGAGGGAPATAGGESSAGHGASAGAYAEKFILAKDLEDSVTVTLGAAGTPSSGSAGGDGGATSFGSHVSANGGLGGGVIGAGSTPLTNDNAGANQNTTSGADFAIPGEHGDMGYRSSATAGTYSGGGGKSVFGAGGRGRGGNSDGSPAAAYGAGGGGARNGASQSARPGGAGGASVVRIELFF